MRKFNDGDLVYCPDQGGELFRLDADMDAFKLINMRSGIINRYVTQQGTRGRYNKMPIIVDATEENRLALTKMYGIEFDSMS